MDSHDSIESHVTGTAMVSYRLNTEQCQLSVLGVAKNFCLPAL